MSEFPLSQVEFHQKKYYPDVLLRTQMPTVAQMGSCSEARIEITKIKMRY